MAKLEQLRTALSKAQNAAGKVLDITANTFPDELGEVKSFFGEVLSASALKIENSGSKPLINTDTEGEIMVTGLAGIFDLPKAAITLVFTEPEDGQLDVDATLILPENVAVKIGHLPSLNLTSPAQEVEVGMKKTGSTFSLGIKGKDGKPIQLPGISEVAKLTEGLEFASLLPESLVSMVNGIAFNELAAEFDPTAKTVSLLDVDLQYLFGSNDSGTWRVAPGVLVESLRFKLIVENAKAAPGEERSASGAAFGNLKIGDVQLPLEFRSANANAELWQAKIQEGETVVLPTLGGLLAKFLDQATVDSLPTQLATLPGITVKDLTLEFDPKKKKNPSEKTLKNLQFDLSADDEWEVVEEYLAVKDNQLNLSFENLLDSAERKIFGTAKSSLEVGSAPFELSLEKKETAETWTISGSLAEGEKFKMLAFFNQFLKDFSTPTDLPDFDIDTAVFSLDMLTKELSFESGSKEGIEIASGYGINGLGISITRKPGAKPTDPADITAALTGAILAAGIDLTLKAEIAPNDEGTGKDFKFETTAATGNDIPIGKLVGSLAAFGDISVPESLDGVTISNLEAIYQPGKELTFGFLTVMETDADSVEAKVLLRMTKNEAGSWDKVFEGLLSVGDLEFEMNFSAEAGSKSFFASLRPGGVGEISLSDLMKRFVEDPDGLIPDVTVSLNEAFVSYSKPTAPTGQTTKGTLLLGVSVGVDMSFGDGLPLVGPMLDGQFIGVDSVLFTYTSSELKLPDLRKLNQSLPKGKPKLPEVDMPGGIGLAFSMAFGKLKQYIALPVAEQAPPASPNAPTPTPVKPQRESDGKWFAVNKRLGPMNIARVGVNFKEKVLTFGVDASLTLGPLTLMLEEFMFGSRIDRFEPVFGMRGFGIEYGAGPVEISGFFLRKPSNLPGVSDEFTGAALIKTPTLTLKAVGAFAMVRGEPSFYLYAYLGYPIGGPAFFFVEGLAAGFGFNRSVKMPTIDEVQDFPLVAIAIGDEDFLTVAEHMTTGGFVPIDPGKLFLAVGLRFTTFKQLDSFLLIIATFGNGFRLDLLGLSKLTVPSPGPGVKNPVPLAEIELAIKGTFAPDEGFVGVQAQLTKNSYILSRDCYLTGGFAFFTWFGDNPNTGDFVISMGGYHPQFKRPSHYPVVPRLGFNWQVSSTINVKGGMYFALTPAVVMAGGRLEATFSSGGLKAWFIIGADFIIGWKPYFYDARMYMSMGVSYTFWFFGKQTVSFDIGADLHIWGPEFSGTAYIDLGIVDFTVEFGSGASQTVKPIAYDEFKKSFLPSANVATVSATDGLLKEIKSGEAEVWVVNPKEFLFTTDSPIPAKQFTGSTDSSFSPRQDLGIGMMGVQHDQLLTQHSVKIFKGSDDFTAEFLYEPVTKPYPTALWGDQLVVDKNAPRVIADALSGVKIKPKPPKDPDQMGFLDQAEFQFQTLTIGNAFHVGDGFGFTKGEDAATVLVEHFTRTELLRSLGFEPASDFEIPTEQELGLTGTPVTGSYASAGMVPS